MNGTLVMKPGRRGVINFDPKFFIDQPCLICDAVTLTVEIDKECLCKPCLDALWLQKKTAVRLGVER